MHKEKNTLLTMEAHITAIHYHYHIANIRLCVWGLHKIPQYF